MPPISRRDFLKSLSVTALSALLPMPFSASPLMASPSQRSVLIPNGAARNVLVVDLETQNLLRTIEVGFPPHNFVHHPVHKENVICIDRNFKKNTSLVEAHVPTGKIVKVIPGGDYCYCGHGFFMPDNETFFVSCIDKISGAGHLLGYNTTNGTLVANYHVSDGGTHDCRLLPDGSALIALDPVMPPGYEDFKDRFGHEISMGGVLRIDIQTGKKISLTASLDSNQAIRHIYQRDDGMFILRSKVLGGDKPGNIYISKLGDKTVTPLILPDQNYHRKPGEIFGFAVNKKLGLAAATDPNNRLIIVFDLHSGEFLHYIPHNVWNIEYDPRADEFLATGTMLSKENGRLSKAESFTLNNMPFYGMLDIGHTLMV